MINRVVVVEFLNSTSIGKSIEYFKILDNATVSTYNTMSRADVSAHITTYLAVTSNLVHKHTFILVRVNSKDHKPVKAVCYI